MKNKTQEISKKDLITLYKSNICDTWKRRIADVLVEQLDSKIIEVSTLTINQAFKEANTEQKELIKKYFDIHVEKKIFDKIENLNDIYKLNNITDNILAFNKASNPYEKYINACILIPFIVNAYNEGESLDWTNSNQSKYLPYYKKTSRSWVYGHFNDWGLNSGGSASHHYKNIESLLDAVKKFNDIYVDFFSYKG